MAGSASALGGGDDDGMGLAEVSVGGTIANASAEAFGKGLATLGDLFRMLDSAVSALPKRPEAIEMEFRAKLTGECDLWSSPARARRSSR